MFLLSMCVSVCVSEERCIETKKLEWQPLLFLMLRSMYLQFDLFSLLLFIVFVSSKPHDEQHFVASRSNEYIILHMNQKRPNIFHLHTKHYIFFSVHSLSVNIITRNFVFTISLCNFDPTPLLNMVKIDVSVLFNINTKETKFTAKKYKASNTNLIYFVLNYFVFRENLIYLKKNSTKHEKKSPYIELNFYCYKRNRNLSSISVMDRIPNQINRCKRIKTFLLVTFRTIYLFGILSRY